MLLGVVPAPNIVTFCLPLDDCRVEVVDSKFPFKYILTVDPSQEYDMWYHVFADNVEVVFAPVLLPPLLSNHPLPLFKSHPKNTTPDGLYNPNQTEFSCIYNCW